MRPAFAVLEEFDLAEVPGVSFRPPETSTAQLFVVEIAGERSPEVDVSRP